MEKFLFLLIFYITFGAGVAAQQNPDIAVTVSDTAQVIYTFPLVINSSVRVSSGFGYRFHPVDKKYKEHRGIDLAASKGTMVISSFSGKVLRTGYESRIGYHVVIKSFTGLEAIYGHLDAYCVKEGKLVLQGSLIGWVGATGTKCTGPHLHFSLKKEGVYINPLSYLIKSLQRNW